MELRERMDADDGVTTRRAEERVVGRERELALLAAAQRSDGPSVVFVHGLGGMGKTSLLRAYEHLARGQDATVAAIDCRSVEPTEDGLVGALAAALGSVGTLDGVLAAVEKADAAVILLDTYERFRLLDGWVRQVLVPRLPGSALLAIGAREPPAPGWEASPDPAATVQRLALGPLSEEAALAVLCEGGALAAAEARRINGVLRGHPLALRVARAAVIAQPDLDVAQVAVPRAMEALTELYLDELDAATRRVVDAAATIRRSTRSLLAALLGDGADTDALDRLRRLPFVELAPHGLHLHDTVQQTAAEVLRSTDPVRYRAHRRAAWRQLRKELAGASPGELWRYTADLLYLIDQPVVREAFFPSSGARVAVEAASEADGAAIRSIVEQHDRPGRASALVRWWERMPESFSVARDRSGQVVGFDSAFEYRDARPDWLQQDPLTRRWVAHLREDRLANNQLVLFNPRWLDREVGDRPSDSQAAFFIEAKRTYLELRPHVRRLYVAVTDISPYAVTLPRLGFRSLPEPQVVVEDVTYHSFVLDLGPGSMDGWLSWLIGSELGVDDDEPILDFEQLQLRLRGKQVQLSPLEFGVAHVLIAREGRAVSRADLIEQVWDSTYLGGSNVVDAVVRTLRKKLGDTAPIIETVRGVGYRYARM
jgi:hypothetical protein